MSTTTPPLSRREREIMEVLYAAEGLTAAEVRERMPDAPGYSAVRALLRILEGKGHIRHEERGPRYVYSPVVSRAKARKSALKSLVQTFFDGSPEQAVAALIDESRTKLGAAELDRLALLIAEARKEGR
jgi:BlaI family penicillinase repressor